jgi:hypothetical protein
MSITIPVGGLAITEGPDGQLSASLALHLGTDMTLLWLGAALAHVRASEAASLELGRLWKDGGSPEETAPLEQEFLAAMQACTAAAFSLDAFYASVQHHHPLDAATKQAWQRNRLARHKRIAETLRIAFGLPQHVFECARTYLKDLFWLRDEAVHPKSGTHPTLLHPRINVQVERRFGLYRHENARAVAISAVALLALAARTPRRNQKPLCQYCEHLRLQLADAEEEWLTLEDRRFLAKLDQARRP